MKCKLMFWIVIGIALLMGILAVSLPIEMMGNLIMVSRFFDVMIPVLAVAALIKYLYGWCDRSSECDTKK